MYYYSSICTFSSTALFGLYQESATFLNPKAKFEFEMHMRAASTIVISRSTNFFLYSLAIYVCRLSKFSSLAEFLLRISFWTKHMNLCCSCAQLSGSCHVIGTELNMRGQTVEWARSPKSKCRISAENFTNPNPRLFTLYPHVKWTLLHCVKFSAFILLPGIRAPSLLRTFWIKWLTLERCSSANIADKDFEISLNTTKKLITMK